MKKYFQAGRQGQKFTVIFALVLALNAVYSSANAQDAEKMRIYLKNSDPYENVIDVADVNLNPGDPDYLVRQNYTIPANATEDVFITTNDSGYGNINIFNHDSGQRWNCSLLSEGDNCQIY